MGNSDSNQIPAVLKLVSELNPQSIVDLGIGRGRYGALFRLTLDRAGINTDRRNWKLRIDGVEGFAPYLGELQNSIYDRIIVSSIQEAAPELENYDVILMGDVLEHFEKDEGRQLISLLLTKAKKRLIIVTPNGPYEQDALRGNEYERHRSYWVPADFLAFPNAEIYANSKTIIAALSEQPVHLGGRRWRIGERPLRRFSFSERARQWWKYRLNRLK